MLTARVLAGRSTRFWGYVDHDRKDHDKAYRETQTRETTGTWLGTKKANEKIEYGHKRAGRRGAEAVGRQALAERAASEAKFVLIAERKTQEEA